MVVRLVCFIDVLLLFLELHGVWNVWRFVCWYENLKETFSQCPDTLSIIILCDQTVNIFVSLI